MQISKYLLALVFAISAQASHAEILPKAEIGIKIPMVKKPTTRPMTIAYSPEFNNYYVADGGLAPLGTATEAPISKSQIHAFTAKSEYINSEKPGYDNRSIYYNPNSKQLETITYNISSAAGFAPNTGIFGLKISGKGEILINSIDVAQVNPAFGNAATMPSYNPDTNQYLAKQERSNEVFVVDLKSREKVSTITLDLKEAGAKFDDITDNFIAYTGVKGQELCALDIDHKAALLFNLKGEYVGRSELPKELKIRAQNHYTGTGYTNGMLFVYYETQGEFGTYYGYKVTK